MTRGEIIRPSVETALAQAWRTAATDLQFEFVSPYTFVDNEGNPHTCAGLLVHFGGPKGTLIISQYDDDAALDVVGPALGFYTSALNPRAYEKYDRERFIDTLTDWGWYGDPEKRPAWFTQ